eukprot:TRINITY_DN2680_c0_g1_i1.p1 TRINITY_DN2680_c0_g1~~TRINITY_DN2680_c0_g1_i1.p1  ORF type:complete len:504 (+),score=125.15 TRINITY_DN2680_c0_g1_i1:200-1711(+)
MSSSEEGDKGNAEEQKDDSSLNVVDGEANEGRSSEQRDKELVEATTTIATRDVAKAEGGQLRSSHSSTTVVALQLQGWESLPEEMLVYIFSFLSCKDLLEISLVNKRWKQLAEDETIWKQFCKREWELPPEVNAEFTYWKSWKKAYKSLVYLNSIAPKLRTKTNRGKFSDDPITSEYVTARFHRPPEVVLGGEWCEGSDMWAIGTILAEMYSGRPLFFNTSTMNFLYRVFEVLGPPTEDDLASIGSPFARTLIESLGQDFDGVITPLEELLPNMPPDGMSVLKQLLVWDPTKRLPAWKALHHPFVSLFTTGEELRAWEPLHLPPLTDIFKGSTWRRDAQDILVARQRKLRKYAKTRDALRDLLKSNSQTTSASPSSTPRSHRRRASKKASASLFASSPAASPSSSSPSPSSSSSSTPRSGKQHSHRNKSSTTASPRSPASTTSSSPTPSSSSSTPRHETTTATTTTTTTTTTTGGSPTTSPLPSPSASPRKKKSGSKSKTPRR